jgi:hypothetical protein
MQRSASLGDVSVRNNIQRLDFGGWHQKKNTQPTAVAPNAAASS